MNDYGLVSIITPAFNNARFIAQMIDSVVSQTYPNWELLITDDCSSDETRSIVEARSAKDTRIKYYCLEKNSGAGVARNNSIKEARGRFIAFLDSDDKWMPEKLERQLAFMVSKDCALSYTSYMTCSEDDEVTGMVLAPNKHTFAQNKRDDKIGFSTAIYDVEKLGKRYMPTLRKRQDWGLVLDLLRDCKVAYGLKQPLSYYRKGQESLSKNKKSLIKYSIAVYQKVFGWNYIHAACFLFLVFIPCNIWKKATMRWINNY